MRLTHVCRGEITFPKATAARKINVRERIYKQAIKKLCPSCKKYEAAQRHPNARFQSQESRLRLAQAPILLILIRTLSRFVANKERREIREQVNIWKPKLVIVVTMWTCRREAESDIVHLR